MAVPAGYPYPPAPFPYMPAVIVKPETISGIRSYQISLVLDIVFGVFALIISLTAIAFTTTDSTTTLSLTAMLAASACGLVIVFIINFIVSLMSVMKMHHGADEYGAEHAKNASRGVMFKWLGTGLSTVATVLVVYMVISGASFLFFPGGALTLTAFVPLLVTIFWTAGVTCKGQMYRHMVRALQPPELRWRADIASLLIPALGIVGIGVVGFLTLSVLRLIQNPGSVNPISASQLVQGLIGGAFLPPGLALIGYVLFLTVYLRTSDRLSQGLSQVHASMPVMPMWPGYPPQPGQVPPTAPPSPAASSPAPAPTAAGTCPQCGQSVTPEAVFCMNCGARTKA